MRSVGADEFRRLIADIRLDMLDLLGKGYVIDHCVSLFHKEQKDKQYRAYITDALMAITETLADRYGGRKMSIRWIEMNQPPKPEDERTGEEIKESIMSKLKKLGGEV